MIRYAQLDQNNLCTAISELHSRVNYDNMVELTDNSINPLGMQYHDGKWTALAPTPLNIADLKLTVLDKINTQNTLTTDAGTDILTSLGTKHFTATIKDQMALSSEAQDAANGLCPNGVLWHAENEPCHPWSLADFNLIATGIKQFVGYNDTYLEFLKVYINRITDTLELEAVEYGMPLPDDLNTQFNAIISSLQGGGKTV